jgi:hypothetical protein
MKLSLITSDTGFAQKADDCGVDRIMIDLEKKGKEKRQADKGLFLSAHLMENISSVKKVLRNAQLMVRVNSIDEESRQEIDEVIARGADLIMLPYFHTIEEAELFCKYVAGRAKIILLAETKEAINIMPLLIQLKEVDEIHIGLNDLSISMQYRSIFEPVYNGTIQALCNIIKASGKPYGFGGIGKLSATHLPVPPEFILAEQVRLGCTIGWLGRTFRETIESKNCEAVLVEEISMLRTAIKKWKAATAKEHQVDRELLYQKIRDWEDVVPNN